MKHEQRLGFTNMVLVLICLSPMLHFFRIYFQNCHSFKKLPSTFSRQLLCISMG